MSNSKDRSSDEWADQDSSTNQGEERAGSLVDLLGALMGGAGSGGGPLGGLGQDNDAPGGSGQAGGGGLGQGGNLLGGLLGMLLGGGEPKPESSWDAPQQQAAPEMGSSGDLLGALLGGGTGAGMSGGVASLLTPLIRPLAQKLGIPVEIAQVVVVFVLTKLLSGKLGQGATPQTQAPYPSQPSGPSGGSGGIDLASILQQMSGGRSVDTTYLRSSGLTDELVQQTGLDPKTAEQSLQEVLRMLSAQAGGAASAGMTPEPSREEGQGSISHRADEMGTVISGQVVDQRNGRGISDVLVVALRPGVSVRQFVRQPLREMAYTSVRTDANGQFIFPQRLPKGQAYGLVVVAHGYRDLAAESALRIEPDMPDRAELNPIALMPD